MDVFTLDGGWSAGPAVSSDALGSDALGVLEKVLYLDRFESGGKLTLSGDAPVSVNFGSLTAAHVVILQTTGKVRARLTTSDGATQSVPVDPIFVLVSEGVPVTAIDLTRVSGVETIVSVFIGQRTTS
jgi:hypothetical protein